MNEILAPPHCLCFCSGEMGQGQGLPRCTQRAGVYPGCTQARRRPAHRKHRAHPSRNTSGFSHTLALCGPQLPHLPGTRSLHLPQGQQRKKGKNPHIEAPVSRPASHHQPENNSEVGTHSLQVSLPAPCTVAAEPESRCPRRHAGAGSRTQAKPRPPGVHP